MKRAYLKTSLSMEKEMMQKAKARAKGLDRPFSNYVQQLVREDLEKAAAQRGANK